MQIDHGIVKLGFEIEVPAWNAGSYTSVAERLVEQGNMMSPVDQWDSTHTYHCDCLQGGCTYVRNGQVMYPPIVSMTYDGSLPEEGAEFVTTPIILGSTGLKHFKPIWETVCQDAVWTMELENIHGGMCSPSIHVHASARAVDHDDHYGNHQYRDELLQTLTLFAPEFYILADRPGQRRGTKYRLPTREAMYRDDQGTHHGFVQVRSWNPGDYCYIEWRLFEAAYDSWEYMAQAAYLSATLSRALIHKENERTLTAVGNMFPHDDRALTEAGWDNRVHDVFGFANHERMDTLRQLCIQQISDDPEGEDLLRNMFAQAQERIDSGIYS